MATSSPSSTPLTTITLRAAREALKSPSAPWLVDQLAQLSEESIRDLGPLMFDAIEMENQYLGKKAVKRMIAQCPEWINQRDKGSNTPLMAAALRNRLDIVELLMEAGANTGMCNNAKLNALDIAAHLDANHRWQEALGLALLEKGKFTQAQKDGALYYAASQNNLGMTRVLLAHGAKVVIIPDVGTALTAACDDPYEGNPTEEIVRTLLATPSGMSMLDHGWDCVYGSAVHVAAASGKVDAMSALIEAGASVNPPKRLRSTHPFTPLMRASYALQPESLRRLIRAGADATVVDNTGSNVLHYLASSDLELEPEVADPLLLQALSLLADAGADPLLLRIRGAKRQLPADTAIEAKRPVLAEALIALASSHQMDAKTSGVAPVATAGSRAPRL